MLKVFLWWAQLFEVFPFYALFAKLLSTKNSFSIYLDLHSSYLWNIFVRLCYHVYISCSRMCSLKCCTCSCQGAISNCEEYTFVSNMAWICWDTGWACMKDLNVWNRENPGRSFVISTLRRIFLHQFKLNNLTFSNKLQWSTTM